MRVAMLPAPFAGHAFPMVPLAWALRAAGHDVTVVTGADGLSVHRCGLRVVDALPGHSSLDILAGFAAGFPQLHVPVPDGDAAALHRKLALLTAVWDPYVDRWVDAALGQEPDLVVYDPIICAGQITAARLGVPAVAHNIGIVLFPPELLHGSAPAFERHGVEPDVGVPTVDVAPPSLTGRLGAELAQRFVPFNGGGRVPALPAARRGRPRIAVTVGTVVPKTDGPGLLHRIAASAGRVAADFLIAHDGPVPAPPGGWPDNVHLLGWVPLAGLLRECVALVHHGGAGTALTACAAGVPQLVLAHAADREHNASALAGAGVAITPARDELGPAAFDRLLTDPGVRGAARALAGELAGLPSPAEVAARLTTGVGRSGQAFCA
jgi:UDP:flavonoid glycosyltransferase YjiC (YdhE family)